MRLRKPHAETIGAAARLAPAALKNEEVKEGRRRIERRGTYECEARARFRR
jgi:hypothetical protein